MELHPERADLFHHQHLRPNAGQYPLSLSAA